MANEWVQVGARVAEYTSGNHENSVRFATIERLTTTQVILSNGRRYNRTTLRRLGQTYGATLEDIASERVKAAYAAKVVNNALYEISVITRNKAIRGVAILDEVDRLVAEARKRIENMATD